jgi:hypothetical protein
LQYTPTMACLIYSPVCDCAQFSNLMRHRYERRLQWGQNRSKATMWQLYKCKLFGGANMFLVDWRLCMICYYSTTSTYYPSTTRGTSVGPPVAVDIDVCWYLRYLSIIFDWSIWVLYATNNFSGQERVYAS